MRTRLHILTGALLAFLAVATAAATAASTPPIRVTEARHATFPKRVYVLTLPEGVRLDPALVKVTENGHEVENLTVLPSTNAGGSIFGSVLAIDASNSMQGKPIKSAWAAAKGFAAGRNTNQRLALLTFNGDIDLAQPFTTSQAEIDRTLSKQPKTAFGTHLYDAVVQGVALLKANGIGIGSIVLLTDGADVGSRDDVEAAIRAARANHVRVFTVGLRSKSFRAGPLERLAAETGGTFAKANTEAALAPIYERLGLQLSREYLLTYDSIAHPNRQVDVTIAVEGMGTSRAEYVTPKLGLGYAVYESSPVDRVWQSTPAMLATALLVPALIAFAIYLLLRRRSSTILTRVSDYVSMRQEQTKEGEDLASRLFVGTEKSLERTRWWSRYKEALALADINIPPVQIIAGTILATGFAAWVFYLIGGIMLALVAVIVPFVVRGLIRAKLARRRRTFSEQLPDNLDVLASALRAGHSLVAALAVVVNEAPEPSRTEFRRVVADEQLGVAIEEALLVVGERMKSRDIEQVALVASIQGQTGGNAAEVLDRVTESIRERVDLRRLVRTLTAQGRLARWIVSLLPVGLMAAITILNPDYIKPLYEELGGRILLVISAMMIIAGSVVIGKIVDIEI